jgi:hypothetical protein
LASYSFITAIDLLNCNLLSGHVVGLRRGVCILPQLPLDRLDRPDRPDFQGTAPWLSSARYNLLQQFTRFEEGLKCVQVYSPGGYFGSVTVELAKIPSPVGRIAVAEKIATMSGSGTPTQISPGMQDGKQIYHVKYRLSDLDSDDSAELCKKRLTSAAAQLKQGLRTTVYPRPHHRNVHLCDSKTLMKKGGTWDQAETFVRRNFSVVEPSAGAGPSASRSVAGPSADRSVAGPPSARPSAGPSAGPSAAPSAGPSARPSTAPTVTTTLGFGSLAMEGPRDGNGHKGKGKERAEVEVGKKQGRVREISENSLVKDLVPRTKRTVVFSPEPDIAPLAADFDPAPPALEAPPPAALQQSTVVATAVAVAPVAAPVNVVAVETDPGTALERLRAADVEFEAAQRRRKAALEELLRV